MIRARGDEESEDGQSGASGRERQVGSVRSGAFEANGRRAKVSTPPAPGGGVANSARYPGKNRITTPNLKRLSDFSRARLAHRERPVRSSGPGSQTRPLHQPPRILKLQHEPRDRLGLEVSAVHLNLAAIGIDVDTRT